MTKNMLLACVASGLLFVLSTNANAQVSGTGSPGASSASPGHEMQQRGSVRGDPGASGYSPGDQRHDKSGTLGRSDRDRDVDNRTMTPDRR